MKLHSFTSPDTLQQIEEGKVVRLYQYRQIIRENTLYTTFNYNKVINDIEHRIIAVFNIKKK